jgi:hypothetical protein
MQPWGSAVDTITTIFPSLASSAIYAGAVWLFFSTVDDKFPSLREPVLDWITRKDRTLPLGRIYVSIICAGIGERAWSRRRFAFVVLAVLSTLLFPLLAFTPRVFAIFDKLLGPAGGMQISLSTNLFLHSLTYAFHPLDFTPLFAWRGMIVLFISMAITVACTSLFIHIVRRRDESVSLWFAARAYGAYLVVTGALAYFAVSLIARYLYVDSPLSYDLFRDWKMVSAFFTTPDFCQRILEESEELCGLQIGLMQLNLAGHVGFVFMIVGPALIVLILPTLFLIVMAAARVVNWLGVAVDFYARVGDQTALLRTPLRFIGDMASFGVFVVLACASLFK